MTRRSRRSHRSRGLDSSRGSETHRRSERRKSRKRGSHIAGTFGKKPSESHVVWTSRSGDGEGRKRFDFGYLERWANHLGIDYENSTRVDRERGDEPREQHAVVVEWATAKSETVEMGESTWELGGNRTPRTFVEIDAAGMARLKSWDREAVLDLRELWIDGTVFHMETADHGTKTFDAKQLLATNRPDE